MLLDLGVGMGGGHTDCTSRVTLGKLQAQQTPLAALSGLPGLASVLHTATDHVEKSGGELLRSKLRIVEERVEGGSTRVGKRVRGHKAGRGGGNAWYASRLLGFACLSLLHPSGAEVGLLVPAPPGWGQGARE